MSDKYYDGWPDQKLRLLTYCSFLADDPILREKMEKHLEQLTSNISDILGSGRGQSRKLYRKRITNCYSIVA